MGDEPTRIVAAGYDQIADRYSRWAAQVQGDPRDRMLKELTRRLQPGARVLDLGCGAGVPSTKALAEHFEVVGVDASKGQIALARTNVPAAEFIHADMATVELAETSFDGVTALYSISHMPREEHAPLFGRISRWLVPGGLFLATLGVTDDPRWIGDWLGVPMFFSSYDADRNRALVRSAGLVIIQDEVVEIHEPEGAVSFLWVLAEKATVA